MPINIKRGRWEKEVKRDEQRRKWVLQPRVSVSTERITATRIREHNTRAYQSHERVINNLSHQKRIRKVYRKTFLHVLDSLPSKKKKKILTMMMVKTREADVVKRRRCRDKEARNRVTRQERWRAKGKTRTSFLRHKTWKRTHLLFFLLPSSCFCLKFWETWACFCGTSFPLFREWSIRRQEDVMLMEK